MVYEGSNVKTGKYLPKSYDAVWDETIQGVIFFQTIQGFFFKNHKI